MEVLSLRSTLPYRANKHRTGLRFQPWASPKLNFFDISSFDLFVLFVLDIIILLSEALCPDLNVSTRG